MLSGERSGLASLSTSSSRAAVSGGGSDGRVGGGGHMRFSKDGAQQRRVLSAAFQTLLQDSAFGQCVARLHGMPSATLRYGDGLSRTYALNVSFKERRYSMSASADTDPLWGGGGMPSPLASPASISSEATVEGFGHSDQTERNNQERLFAEVAKELVWPLCLFDAVPGFSGEGSGGSGSTNNNNDADAGADADSRLMCTGSIVLVPAIDHATSSRRLRLYRFVGKLMGIAVRTGTVFDLPFAPFVWKLLTNPLVELCVEDLAPLDEGNALKVLSDPELVKKYMKEVGDAFRAVQEEEDEDEVGGEAQGGSYSGVFCVDAAAAARVQFRVLTRRLEQVRLAVAEMRAGMLSVVPGHTMHLFTSEECSRMVCRGFLPPDR